MKSEVTSLSSTMGGGVDVKEPGGATALAAAEAAAGEAAAGGGLAMSDVADLI